VLLTFVVTEAWGEQDTWHKCGNKKSVQNFGTKTSREIPLKRPLCRH